MFDLKGRVGGGVREREKKAAGKETRAKPARDGKICPGDLIEVRAWYKAPRAPGSMKRRKKKKERKTLILLHAEKGTKKEKLTIRKVLAKKKLRGTTAVCVCGLSEDRRGGVFV